MRRILLAGCAVAALGLGGCDTIGDWFGGGSGKPPLPGERISVLQLDRQLEPDPRVADVQVRLPRPYVNAEWPQAGGYPAHVMHHLELSGPLKQAWRADIGASANSTERILAQPLVADGRVFAMDSEGNVSAIDAETGRRIWRVDLTPRSENDGAIGGGIGYDRGRLFATSPYGEVFSLDPASGKTLWQQKIGVPLKASPTIDANRVFVLTQDNQVKALDAETGREIWSYAGIPEIASLIGSPAPAVEGTLLVVPFSSGELFALRADNGVVAWNDTLQRTGRVSPVGTINDISGSPVIDRGRVFAIGHAGRMVSIDLRTGERVWERELAGIQSPWVAGEFVFAVTIDGEVVCLSRREGRIRWVTQLDRYKNPSSRTKKGPIVWYGPVLAGDRLVLTSSHGRAVSLSPYTGKVMSDIRLSGNAAVPPVVANDTLFILTEDASLLALK
jgi:outer membrane protein assembly factor BamB